MPIDLRWTLLAPLAEAWHAFGDRAVLAQWHGWDDPTLPAEIEQIYFGDAMRGTSADGREHTLTAAGGDRFRLTDAGDGRTELVLTRAEPTGDPDVDAWRDTITEGWVSFVEQLRFLLERRPGGPRTATAEREPCSWESTAAGLGVPADPAPGAAYDGRLGDEALAGTVWFATPSQLGLVVDAWGPGLLILQFTEGMRLRTTYPRT